MTSQTRSGSVNENAGAMPPQFYFTKDTADLVLPGPWKEQVAFLMGMRDGTCFRVDTATDMLTTDELFRHSALVQAADEWEIKSFVDDKVFQLIRRQDAPVRPMDCLWVRKWKRKPTANDPGEVKSRLVVRGFLDPQKRHVSRYSGTATRLSQRMLVSLAVAHGLELEQ